MGLVLLLARRSWRMLFIAASAGLVCGLAAAGLIAVVNDGLANLSQLGPRQVVLFVGLALLVVLTRIVADTSLVSLGQTAVNDLRLHLSNKIIDTPYRRLQELGKHRLLAMLTDDTQTISQSVELIPVLLVNLGIVAACLGYLGWLSLPLLGLTALLIGAGALAFNWAQNRALRSISSAREIKDRLFSQYRSLTDGAKELQLNHPRRQRFFDQSLQPTSQSYKEHFVKGMSTYVFVLNWGNGLFYLLIGVVLFLGPLAFELEASLVTGYILTILYIITPLSELMNALPSLGRASVALNKIRALEGQLEYEAPAQVEPPLHKIRSLECRNVSHTYFREKEDGRFVLGPFDLRLNAGETIFIVGGNGSGKTTLALLLTGLYQPESGDILLNGEVSSKSDNHNFRQHFSAIFTDFCLFDQLIGSGEAALVEKAQKYLVHLQLDHKVAIVEGRLSTTELSTGQRKRLALLAAYLDDRPCYLFDEWAADQDPLFKRVFYEEILPDLKRRQKLVIAITHDDAYFHLADRLIKVDQGKIVDTLEKRQVKSGRDLAAVPV